MADSYIKRSLESVLRPYHASICKRLVKTPKVYFLDVGTLCCLVGLDDRIADGYVVHPGTIELPLAPGVRALPFAML